MSETIVYLHGFASGPGSQKARFFRARLEAAGREVRVPDLARGDFENLTITGQLEALDQAAGGRPCALIGSSMGGYLAALYAAQHPEVARVVMMAPAFGFMHRWTESLGSQVSDWKRKGYLEVYHYGERATRRLSYCLVENAARYPDYPDPTQPALIFHGRNDTVVPAACSEEFAARHAKARLVLLDSDHELLDVLDPMWDEAREFLKP